MSISDSWKARTYDDFVAWRDEHHDQRVTVGDAMRYFTATSLETILQWWERDRAEQDAQ